MLLKMVIYFIPLNGILTMQHQCSALIFHATPLVWGTRGEAKAWSAGMSVGLGAAGYTIMVLLYFGLLAQCSINSLLFLVQILACRRFPNTWISSTLLLTLAQQIIPPDACATSRPIFFRTHAQQVHST